MDDAKRVEIIKQLWTTYLYIMDNTEPNEPQARAKDALLGLCVNVQGTYEHPTAWLRKHGDTSFDYLVGGAE